MTRYSAPSVLTASNLTGWDLLNLYQIAPVSWTHTPYGWVRKCITTTSNQRLWTPKLLR